MLFLKVFFDYYTPVRTQHCQKPIYNLPGKMGNDGNVKMSLLGNYPRDLKVPRELSLQEGGGSLKKGGGAFFKLSLDF